MGDELEQLLAARRQRNLDDAAMRAAVHDEMAARMDTGIRVNAMLAQALGVAAGASGGSTNGCVDETARGGLEEAAAEAIPRVDLRTSALMLSGARRSASERPRPRVPVTPLTRLSTIRALGQWIASHLPTMEDAPATLFSSLHEVAHATCPPAAQPPSPHRLFLALLWMSDTHNTTVGRPLPHAAAGCGQAQSGQAECVVACSLLGAAQLPAGRQVVLATVEEGIDVLIALR